MGFPGDFEHPDYSSAVKRVVDAAAANGKPAGMCCSSFEQAADYIDRGLRCIAFDDISLLENSMRSTIERTRASASDPLLASASTDDQSGT
jgi:2-keto-3-deoxy-L-rhamnonate aldolase RhmA